MTNQRKRRIDNFKDINEYYKDNRFMSLLRKTKKTKDFLWSKEALISLLISFSVTLIFLLLFIVHSNKGIEIIVSPENIDKTLIVVKNILPTIIGGLFALLGLTIGGLAIVTGTITEKVITNVRKENVFSELISVIFNFYFCGAIIGLTIIMGIFSYISVNVPLSFNLYLFLFWTLAQTYFIVFSVIYTVMLLGTCIRLFLLRYLYTYDFNQKFYN